VAADIGAQLSEDRFDFSRLTGVDQQQVIKRRFNSAALS
jgi:hypothetical protein